MDDIKKYVEDNYIIAKELLSDLISIRTVKGEKTIEYPFGINMFEAQKIIEHFCVKYGIDYCNLDNYISYSHFGNNDDYVGVWTHLDVVPEGELDKWLFDPYKLTTFNGRLYGRGVIDNKASIIYGLMSLKYMLDSKCNFTKGFRVVFGNDEESGFEDLKYYKKKLSFPMTSFVLDNLFPVTSIEKGVINFDLTIKTKSDIVINGGTKRNVIAEKCSIKYKDKMQNFIASTGHASLSNESDNAIFEAISNCNCDDLKNISIIIKKLKESDWYKNNCCSINIGTIKTQDDDIRLELELRYILNTVNSIDEMLKILKNFFSEFNVLFKTTVKPKYFNKTLVNELLNEYNKYFDTDLDSEISGYITYAHSIPNSVPFGPFTRNNNSAHKFNESISEDEFKKNLEFYTKVFTKKIR